MPALRYQGKKKNFLGYLISKQHRDTKHTLDWLQESLQECDTKGDTQRTIFTQQTLLYFHDHRGLGIKILGVVCEEEWQGQASHHKTGEVGSGWIHFRAGTIKTFPETQVSDGLTYNLLWAKACSTVLGSEHILLHSIAWVLHILKPQRIYSAGFIPRGRLTKGAPQVLYGLKNALKKTHAQGKEQTRYCNVPSHFAFPLHLLLMRSEKLMN